MCFSRSSEEGQGAGNIWSLSIGHDVAEIGGTRANVWQQSAVKSVFIRGSVVRYVHLPAAAVDTTLLEDATRRGMSCNLEAIGEEV